MGNMVLALEDYHLSIWPIQDRQMVKLEHTWVEQIHDSFMSQRLFEIEH